MTERMSTVLRLLVPVTMLLGRAQARLAQDYRESGRCMRLLIFWSWLPLRLMFLAGLHACEALAGT
jgi:hypothetical protein